MVAGVISKKMGTEVSVGHIDLGLFNRIIVNDVMIKDQRDEQLIAARRLSAKIDILPLVTTGQVSISSVQLLGAQMNLYRETAASTPNYQFAIDALSSSDKDSPSQLNLRIGSVIISRLSVCYDQKDAPLTPGKLNSNHLKGDISAHILLRKLTPDSLNLNVKRISIKEHSGIELQKLSFKLEANREQALLSDLAIQLPQSSFMLDTLIASYVFDHFEETLHYRTAISPSIICMADLVSVLPDAIPTNHLFEISASVSGTTKAIDCQEMSIQTTDHSLQLYASGAFSPTAWSADIDNLSLSEDLIKEMSNLEPAIPNIFTNLGFVNLRGEASGHANGDITAKGYVNTATGSLTYQGSYNQLQQLCDAHVATDSLDLKRLLGNNSLGLLSAQLDISTSNSTFFVKGSVPHIDLNGYRYQNLQIDGTYGPTGIAGKLKVDDPHLKTDVEGTFSSSNTPHLKMTGYIERIAPKALRLSDNWNDAVFSAIIDTDISANSLADTEGTIDLDDFVMSYGDTTRYHLDNMHIRSGYDNGRHYMRMKSDFGEALLSGQFDLPTLPRCLASLVPLQSQQTIGNKNDFTLTMRVSDSRWIQQLTGLLLELNGPMELNAQVSEPNKELDVYAFIPDFNVAGNTLQNATLNLSSNGDSAQCQLSTTRVTDKGGRQDFRLTAQTINQQLYSTLNLSTPQGNHGTINTISRFYNNEEGKNETHVRVLPSLFSMNNATWSLEPCDILYSDKRLMIDQFTLHHGDEHLIIDGLASTNASDSLLLDLNGIDVAYLLELVNFHAVQFDGKATGRAYICHAFKDAEAWADIMVDNFHFQQAPMGTLEAHAIWNQEEGQVELDAAIDNGADSQTYIDGYVSPRHKELDLGIRAHGTSIGFIHSFTNSFISRFEGRAYGDVRLHGPLKGLDLTGKAAVTGLAAITPLGTTYRFDGDTVRLAPGKIIFDNFHAFDRDGHHAILNGSLGHTHLTRITFNLQAQADDFLAYDFPKPETGTTVGGTVRVDGAFSLRGLPGETVIDCDVTPSAGSVFYYNVANPDAINQQQFITWGSKAPHDETVHNHEDKNEEDNSTKGDLRVNLRINTTPDATLRLIMDQHSSDNIALNGRGVLRASLYNKGAFQLFGTYDVERGNYAMTIQNIIKKNFQFQPGSSIVFGGDPFQAALHLKALYTVNGVSLSDLGLNESFTNSSIRVNCLMNIVGTAGEPRVEFDLEMPTVNSEEEHMIRSIIASEQELNQQVVYLLGIGRFYTQGANNASTQSYGQTELAMQSLLSGTVSSQINQLLSQVIKNDDWNFGANISTGNEGWHNAEYEGLISGRMLNNRLLINGQFGYRDNATQATPSFIGDFDIQYLLTPGGSFSLKAYNHTNDRYFTHSSLNTQGIGIIMKKDFNGLRDLFTHRKRKEH